MGPLADPYLSNVTVSSHALLLAAAHPCSLVCHCVLPTGLLHTLIWVTHIIVMYYQPCFKCALQWYRGSQGLARYPALQCRPPATQGPLTMPPCPHWVQPWSALSTGRCLTACRPVRPQRQP